MMDFDSVPVILCYTLQKRNSGHMFFQRHSHFSKKQVYSAFKNRAVVDSCTQPRNSEGLKSSWAEYPFVIQMLRQANVITIFIFITQLIGMPFSNLYN